MDDLQISLKLLTKTARAPEFMREGDAAFDLYASEAVRIPPRSQIVVPTGIAMEIPVGFAGLIWDRSGLAAKNQLTTMGGLIDSNYRGEIRVILRNFGDTEYSVSIGDRVAQMVLQRHAKVTFNVVSELSHTNRGDGTFGSSGK